MRQFRYPSRTLMSDYLRSAAGLFVGFGVLLSVPPSLPVVLLFGSLAALFAAFALRTLYRHNLRVAVTDDAIACRGLVSRVIPWQEIAGMKLRYFGSRRSKWRPLGSGFMQLTVKGAGAAMTFESSIEGFEWLAARAAAAMRARGLDLDPATAGNLIELGIDPATSSGSSDECDSPPNVL